MLQLAGAPVRPADLHSIAAYLAHRGPDGDGFHIDGPVGLAHRRLAILDLAAGQQPMASRDRRYWIVFNGEVYNFIELRDELKQSGHTFVTDSDTEVILAAYTQWGEDCQLKFNGMWAFAIWEAHERELFLSRDRFGVKPLHFYCDAEKLVFASELKGFLGLPWIDRTFDPEVFALAIANYPILDATEHCLIKGVRRLRAGHSLTMRPGKPLYIKRWWHTLDRLSAVPRDPRDQSEMFRELFLDACALRMRSDVPLATALSGGLDSSAVHCGIMAVSRAHSRVARRPADWQKAFIGAFSGTPQDETDYANAVVGHVGSEGIVHEISADEVIDNLPRIVYAAEGIHDLPSPAWSIYRAMRQRNVPVSLDGHGGDEVFGGYQHHVRELLNHTKSPDNRARFDETLMAMYVMRHEGVRAPRVHSKDFLNVTPKGHHFPEVADDSAQIESLDSLTQRLYMDFHYYTLPNILQNFDRASMAHGVEIRAPFLDWRLVCFGYALAWSAKIERGYTKYIVRDALRAIMPYNVVHRRSKLGFITPFESWIGGRLGQFIRDRVASRSFLESAIWDGPALRSVAEQAVAEGDGATTRRVWPFIQADLLQSEFQDATEPHLGVRSPGRVAASSVALSN